MRREALPSCPAPAASHLQTPYPGVDGSMSPTSAPTSGITISTTCPGAPALVCHSRETLRSYLAHFCDHWVGRKETVLSDEFEAIVDSFQRSGAFESSIRYYRAREAQRRAAVAPFSLSRLLSRPDSMGRARPGDQGSPGGSA